MLLARVTFATAKFIAVFTDTANFSTALVFSMDVLSMRVSPSAFQDVPPESLFGFQFYELSEGKVEPKIKLVKCVSSRLTHLAAYLTFRVCDGAWGG